MNRLSFLNDNWLGIVKSVGILQKPPTVCNFEICGHLIEGLEFLG